MVDYLWWKTTFERRHPLLEDDHWWKTTFDGRSLQWKMTFNGRQSCSFLVVNYYCDRGKTKSTPCPTDVDWSVVSESFHALNRRNSRNTWTLSFNKNKGFENSVQVHGKLKAWFGYFLTVSWMILFFINFSKFGNQIHFIVTLKTWSLSQNHFIYQNAFLRKMITKLYPITFES